MRKIIKLSFLFLIILASCGNDDQGNTGGGGGGGNEVQKFDPVAVTKSNTMKIWMHYMPWFETPETSTDGKWGQHWTMGNKNPNTVDGSGKREIAAHYYPLIGPYASGDADVLEYHFLLMKYAGIDGILIDWYGTRNYNDYAPILKNTEAIVEALEKVGLEFAIVYEDRTLEGDLDEPGRISQAITDMAYLQRTFFKKDNYIKIDGSPLLLNFGPIIIKTPAEWSRVFSALNPKPAFFPLCYHSQLVSNDQFTNNMGEYIWVDGPESGMAAKYAQKGNFEQFIGGAYPGFNDFYKEGGWGNSVLGDIDYENGALLERLMKLARDEDMDYLQLITWNDFGEGTMIEPTREFQYTFLEKIQAFAGVSYRKANLEAVYNYYNLKKQYKADNEKKKKLLQAFYYLISLQDTKAAGILDEF